MYEKEKQKLKTLIDDFRFNYQKYKSYSEADIETKIVEDSLKWFVVGVNIFSLVIEKIELHIHDWQKGRILNQIEKLDNLIRHYQITINSPKFTNNSIGVNSSESIKFMENNLNDKLKEKEYLMKQLELISRK